MLLAIDASRANHREKTGVEWYAFHLIQELKKITPDDVRVVLYTDEPLQGELAELPKNWTEKVLKWPPRRLWTQVRMSWEMLVNPPDVLFIPAHVPPFIHPKKTVVTIHDIAAIKFPETYNWFERWYSVFTARYALKNCWRVIVPSEFARNELSSLQVGKLASYETGKKVKVIHHGYDEKYRKIDDVQKIDDVLQKYGISRPFLLSVGRLEEKKNTVQIIKAFKLLKNELKDLNFDPKALKLVLVGKPGYGYEKVKEVLNSSTYKTDILLPGWMSEDDLPCIMNAAEVFVFPSLYEGFGLPVLQAFACGVPVVASKGSGLEEVGGEAAIYVDPLSEVEMKHGIHKLLLSETLRHEKIKLGFERVEKFSWRKCAEESLRVLLS